ncbi:MAG: Stp1/IreP family PP2C-type Ser/Thr phosphatase [Bacteroidota bacterium]
MRRLTYGNYSHVGMVRSENQDSYGKFPDGNNDLGHPGGQLFIIADGMGGQNAGREASAIAVRTLADTYYAGQEPSVIPNLRRAFAAANEAIYRKSITGPQYRGMGTTCVALVLQDGHAFIGNIGDSRVYKINQRGITQLTNDHSKVAEMVRRGIITKDEARNHPERSHLYRAMGPRPNAEVDFFDEMPLTSSRWYLMCTDGLFNHVSEEEMRGIVMSGNPDRACRQLVQLANERGGSDNITVQVVKIDVNATSFSPLARGKERLKAMLKPRKQ